MSLKSFNYFTKMMPGITFIMLIICLEITRCFVYIHNWTKIWYFWQNMSSAHVFYYWCVTTARVTWEEPGGHIEKASHFLGTTESNDMGNVKNRKFWVVRNQRVRLDIFRIMVLRFVNEVLVPLKHLLLTGLTTLLREIEP